MRTTRTSELDAMSEADKEADIMERIRQHGAVSIDRREQLGFWGAAIERLRARGEVQVREHGSDEQQWTSLEVTAS